MFVGARPWQQIHQPTPRPEPEMTRWEAFQAGEMLPPWEADARGDTVVMSPNFYYWDKINPQAKRIMRAIAVDMASVKLRPIQSQTALAFREAVERLAALLISYPHASSQRTEKQRAAHQILNVFSRWINYPVVNLLQEGSRLPEWMWTVPDELRSYAAEPYPWGVREAAQGAIVAGLVLAMDVHSEYEVETADGVLPASISALADFAMGGFRATDFMRWPFRFYGEANNFAETINYWIDVWWEECKNVLAFRGYGKILY